MLVTAAGGATGHMGAQLAMLAGCRVVATCGSQRKAERLQALGIHRVINYRQEVSSTFHVPARMRWLPARCSDVSEHAIAGAKSTPSSLILGFAERAAATPPESVHCAGCERGAQQGIPSAD